MRVKSAARVSSAEIEPELEPYVEQEPAPEQAELDAEPEGSANEHDAVTVRPGPAIELQELRELFMARRYDDVVGLAGAILRTRPDDADVIVLRNQAQTKIYALYTFCFRARSNVLSLLVQPAHLRDRRVIDDLKLEPRHLFLLSLIDGMSTVETTVDVSGMAEHEALHLLFAMVEAGLVAVR